MNGMTTQERYEDISKISGLSVDIIRRVLLAERQSVINSLKRGERATLIGRCSLTPDLRSKLVVGGNMVKQIKVSASVASGLASELEGLEGFVRDSNNAIDSEETVGIMVNQISSLA